jgi:hypothetical protein
MDADDLKIILAGASLNYTYIVKHQTAFELRGLSEALSAYGLTIDDVQIFIESDILPERLLY